MYSKFIPGHFIENLDRISKDNYIRVSGYVMFADLSGFTAMSEKFSALGKEGSEQISNILNLVFEDLIDIIHKNGGSVYKFGGDALTVFYPESIPAQSVINCGIEILNAMRKYKSIDSISGKIRIEVKVGTSFGEVFIGQLGTDEKDYFIAGPTLDKACDCEHNAEKGESIIDAVMKLKLGACRFKKKKENYYIAEKLDTISGNLRIPQVHLTESKTEYFIRQAVLDKEDEGDLGQGELRNCAILFMSFSGVEYGNNFNYNELNGLVTSVFNITAKYGGFVNKVDMGDKGNKIIILFGAPVATEKNEELAGRCALDIISSLKGNISAKIGLNSGNIYFGVIGSKERLEFTVIGNAVNLSARLMTSCSENEIVVSKNFISKIPSAIGINERYLSLKGIRDKLNVSTLQSVGTKSKAQRILAIGRDKEIRQYTEILENKRYNRIFITAEAGMGKSVLADEFMEKAATYGNIVKAECFSYSSDSPYYVLKEIILKLINTIDEDKKSALKRILADLKESANINKYSEFLGLSDSRSESDESMKNIIDDISALIILHFLANNKVFIFIEDLHWADNQSLKIIKQILSAAEKTSGMIHLIYRPDDKLSDIASCKSSFIFEIQSFSKDDGKLYLEKKFKIKKIPKDFYEMIYSRSKGNPFFMDEIILSVKSNKGIEVQADGSYKISRRSKEIAIPDSINDIILSRLDKLDNKSKRILKIASVIGRVFQINILNQLKEFQQKVSGLNLKSRLFDLTKMDFTMFEISKDDEYLFKHAITRDAVYETLLYSLRKKYHEEIARIYEENSGERIENYYELIAFHYDNTNNSLKAKKYLFLSAEKSFGNFAYDGALNYIKMYRKHRLNKEEKAQSYLFESEILRIIEKRDKAVELCERVKKSAGRGNILYDRAVAQNTLLYFKSSRYEDVFKESARLSENCDINLYAKVLAFKGFSQLFTGDTENAERSAKVAMAIKNKLTDKRIVALVLNLTGNINLRKRKISSARKYFENMLDVAEKNQITDERLKALQNISVCYLNSGNYSEAGDFLDKLYIESLKIHNYDLIIATTNNIVSIAYVTGDYKKAEKLAEKSLKMARKYKKFTMIDDILWSLSNIKLEQSKYDEVLKICSKRLSLVKEHNNLMKIPVIKDIMGDAYFKSGEIITALNIYTENLENALKISDIERVGHSYGNIANCYSELREFDKALLYYEKQLKYAADHEDIQSEGKALYTMADTYVRGLNNLVKGIDYARKAKKIFGNIGYAHGIKMADEIIDEIKKK
jgi:class 3 adenylate cyclase/tetratricopeptide (TPR) repeat protein